MNNERDRQQDKLDELYLKLQELRRKEFYHKSSLDTVQREIATIQTSIAEIIDKRQGVLPL